MEKDAKKQAETAMGSMHIYRTTTIYNLPAYETRYPARKDGKER